MQKKIEKQVALMIPNAVKHAQAGKERLVAFLRGSHSQLVKKDEMDKQIGYGALFWYDMTTIAGFIEQLREMELIKRYSVNTGYYSYPILDLTEAGKKVLENKIEIPLLIRKAEKPFVMSDTLVETLKMLKVGKKIDNISKIRNLKPNTVWEHVVKLVALGKLSAKKFVTEEKIKLILEARKKTTSHYMKELKTFLPSNINYEEIKCVLEDRNLCAKKQS